MKLTPEQNRIANQALQKAREYVVQLRIDLGTPTLNVDRDPHTATFVCGYLDGYADAMAEYANRRGRKK